MIEYIKESIQKNTTIILRIFILLILGWVSFGYFPILNIEGDSALFSAGCERLFENGLSLPPDYFYKWDMQPLVGLIVVSVKSLLPLLPCEQIYNILTIFFSISYLFVASVFVSKLSKIRWEYCFFILILFPESYSIGYYSNTAIFASFVSLSGFLFLLKKPLNPFSIILLGIAPLLRVDILAIYPVVLFLLWRHFDFRKSVIYSIIYAISVLSISGIGFWLLRANPLSTLNEYSSLINQNSHTIDFESFIRINASFYPVSIVIMIVIGILSIIKLKNYKLLVVAFLPIVTLYIIYKDFSGAAPKHIQYLLPFAGILVAFALKELKNQFLQKKYVLSFIVCLFILIQFLIGVRVFPTTKPWISKTYSVQYPRPKITTLASCTVKKLGDVELVIGAGQIIPTADELMLISGNFFAPFYWNYIKRAELRERKVLEKIISKGSDSLYIMTTQASDWPLSQQLHSIGYVIRNIDEKIAFNSDFCFVRGKKKIFVKCINIERNPESFNSAFHTIENRPLYILSDWDWQLYLINERKTDAEPISKKLSIIRR